MSNRRGFTPAAPPLILNRSGASYGGLPTAAAARVLNQQMAEAGEGHITATRHGQYVGSTEATREQLVAGRARVLRAESRESGFRMGHGEALARSAAEYAAVDAGTYVPPSVHVTQIGGVRGRKWNEQYAEALAQQQGPEVSDAPPEAPAETLGDGASDYAAWYQSVRAAAGNPSITWPFNTGIYANLFGKPAAKYDANTYARGVNARMITTSLPTEATRDSSYVYVVAPQSAWAGAPQTMTWFQRAENSIFTTGDRVATATGLPSLKSVEDFLKTLGKDALGLVAVAAVAWYLIKHNGGGLRDWQ